VLKLRPSSMAICKNGRSRNSVGGRSFCEGFVKIIIVFRVCNFSSQIGHLKWRVAKVFHFPVFFFQWVVLKLRPPWMTFHKNGHNKNYVGGHSFCEEFVKIIIVFRICNFSSQLANRSPKMTLHEGFPFFLFFFEWAVLKLRPVGMTICKNGRSCNSKR
jgi:hypothetical protein